MPSDPVDLVMATLLYNAVRTAVRAWSRGLAACGFDVPPWIRPRRVPRLLAEFADHSRRLRGAAPQTIAMEVWRLRSFLGFLARRRRTIRDVRLLDIDNFIVAMRRTMARSTVAQICSCIRIFLRFLHATGRVPHDLASAVLAPRHRASDRPPRAKPWSDVTAILRGIDRRTPEGCRDYALLTLMAVYGLAAREVRDLRLDDIDWTGVRFRVRRSKTGREIMLPLLPGISRAIVAYVRHGRPTRTTSRALFVQALPPHREIRHSGSIAKILRRHAEAVDVGDFLGSHAMRHSHATRQVELGAPPKVVGDILGHIKPSSTSIYMRVALRRLEGLALPVPR